MTQSEGPRIVSKYVEGLVATYTHSGEAWAITTATNATGWVNVGGGVFTWRGYIDLSGYRPSDMVLSTRGAQIQYGANFYSSGANLQSAGGNFHLQYAITTDKVDDLAYGAAGVAEPLVGFIGDNSEMEQVVIAGSESWGPASAGISSINHQNMTFGDGPPIVSERLYVCIRVALAPAIVSGNYTDTGFAMPPMRFVVIGEAQEIPTYQMLHLMKRQVDLQQTPDVDA